MADIDPFASATQLLAALRAGRVSAGELTNLYICRIERYDGQLNAVVVRDFERASARGPPTRRSPAASKPRCSAADHAQGIHQRRGTRDNVRCSGVEGLRLAS